MTLGSSLYRVELRTVSLCKEWNHMINHLSVSCPTSQDRRGDAAVTKKPEICHSKDVSYTLHVQRRSAKNCALAQSSFLRGPRRQRLPNPYPMRTAWLRYQSQTTRQQKKTTGQSLLRISVQNPKQNTKETEFSSTFKELCTKASGLHTRKSISVIHCIHRMSGDTHYPFK